METVEPTQLTQRTFIPGTEWIYYKFYCGSTTATVVLTEILSPLMQRFLEERWSTHWFFIRYHDPNSHLRFRIHLSDPKHFQQVTYLLTEKLQYFVEEGMIWNIQLDTYKREIERYGSQTMSASENLFYRNSELVVDVSKLTPESSYKVCFAILLMDYILSTFGYDLEQKIQFAQHYGEAFKSEFKATPLLRKQLNKKYQDHRELLGQFMVPETATDQDILAFTSLVNDYDEKCRNDIAFILHAYQNGQPDVTLDSLIASHIHMFINRYYETQQRRFEMVCYDFLVRYYLAERGKQRNQTRP